MTTAPKNSVSRPIFITEMISFTAFIPLSFVLVTQQRVLKPLYGSYLTHYSLDVVVILALLTSVFTPLRIEKGRNWLVAGLFLTISPNASFWVAVWTSRNGWPILGPALTHIVVVAPLVFIFTNPINQRPDTALHHKLLQAIVTFVVTKLLAQKLWPGFSLLSRASESQILLTLAAIAFSAFIFRLEFSPSLVSIKTKKKTRERPFKSSLSPSQIKATIFAAFAAFWYLISPHLANPILPHPLQETFTHPTGKLQIHSAVQSVTGLIVVGETLPPHNGEEDSMHSARYLRADHSLLGGVWVRDRAVTLDHEPFVTDAFGAKLGDTVYSTFVLQEAARLVNSTEAGKTGQWRNALTIGLGTGLSTSAFIRHGINTTVVEIDPAVYDAARTWFGLPDPGPGNVFLEDARNFVEGRSREIQAGDRLDLYDIVVHDCFSGGGVPEHIFTTEFWSSLKQIMDSEGILVVNFAGILNSQSSRMVLHTLEHNFGECRAFHDLMGTLEEDKYDEDFINLVFFCTKSTTPITFRAPKRSDYLGSHLRRFIFKGLNTREINLNIIRSNNPEEFSKYLLTDKENPLGNLQQKQGLHHWEVMRKVMRDIHWETF